MMMGWMGESWGLRLRVAKRNEARKGCDQKASLLKPRAAHTGWLRTPRSSALRVFLAEAKGRADSCGGKEGCLAPFKDSV